MTNGTVSLDSKIISIVLLHSNLACEYFTKIANTKKEVEKLLKRCDETKQVIKLFKDADFEDFGTQLKELKKQYENLEESLQKLSPYESTDMLPVLVSYISDLNSPFALVPVKEDYELYLCNCMSDIYGEEIGVLEEKEKSGGALTEEEKVRYEKLKNDKKDNDEYVRIMKIDDPIKRNEEFKKELERRKSYRTLTEAELQAYNQVIYMLTDPTVKEYKKSQEEWKKNYDDWYKDTKKRLNDEAEYGNMAWYEKVCTNVATFGGAVATGFIEAGETVFDGIYTLGGGAAAWVTGLFDEEAEKEVKDHVKDVVSYDFSGEIYKYYVDSLGLNEYAAYGPLNVIGDTFGVMGGYMAATYLTAGASTPAVVSAMALGGASAAGRASEQAFANDATFDEAFGVAATQFVVGAIVSGANKGISNSQTMSLFAKTAANMAINTTEPIVNAASQYLIYGNDGTYSWEEFFNYAIDSGVATEIAIANAIEIGSSSFDLKSPRSTNTKAIDIDAEIPKVKTIDIDADIPKVKLSSMDDSDFNFYLSNLPETERTALWTEYYNGNSHFQMESDEFLDYNYKHKGERFSVQTNGKISIDEALEQQFNISKSRGYDGDFEAYKREYSSDNFRVDTPAHQKALTTFMNEGGVTVIPDGALEKSLLGTWTDGRRGIGYDNLDGKTGGSWISPKGELESFSAIPTSSTLDSITKERARRGISLESNGQDLWIFEYSPEFLAKNGITFNSGSKTIMGASEVAMPGAGTFDLTGEGVSYTEALTPRVEFDATTADDILNRIVNGDTEINLADYGYDGLILRKYAK